MRNIISKTVPQNVPSASVNAVLTTPSKIFPCNLQERLNIHSFVEKSFFFLKVFFCTCKMQFWQTRRKYVYKKRKVSGPMSEKTNRTTFFSKNYFSSKYSQGQEEGIFWNILKDFPMKSQKFLSQRTKGLKKHIIQKNDLHKDPIVSVKAVLTTMPIFSLQAPRRK